MANNFHEIYRIEGDRRHYPSPIIMASPEVVAGITTLRSKPEYDSDDEEGFLLQPLTPSVANKIILFKKKTDQNYVHILNTNQWILKLHAYLNDPKITVRHIQKWTRIYPWMNFYLNVIE